MFLNRTPSRAPLSLALVMFASILWGTVGVSTKHLYTLADTNALSVGFFRLALAAPVLALACAAVLGRRMLAIAPRDLATMGLTGAALAAYQVCFFAAITRVGVSVATLITLCTAPVITAALTALHTRRRPGTRLLLTLGLALTGTAFLIEWQPAGVSAATTLAGASLALCAATGYAIIAFSSAQLAQRYHALQTTTVSFTSGALLLFAIASTNGLAASYSLPAWGVLLYLGLVPTALGYALFVVGMKHTRAAAATIATLLEPLTATVLAALFFDERLSGQAVIGAAALAAAMGLLFTAKDRSA